ncbi:MAG: hypothetical protein WDZ31_00885 [Phycisphaeraceae bacterium]
MRIIVSILLGSAVASVLVLSFAFMNSNATSISRTTATRSARPSSANTPEQMFENVVLSPVPSSVTDLQGIGDTWQGYSLYLRFGAADVDIDAIIAHDYRPTQWSNIEWRFQLPPGYDQFISQWEPSRIKEPECYEADLSNNWTHAGTHYLVIDRSRGVVYFVGFGA